MKCKEAVTFRVQTQGFVIPTFEARQAPGGAVKDAGLAAWREPARRAQGLEMTHFQIVHHGVTLAVASRLRRDGIVEVEIGLGDPRQAARAIPAAELKRPETGARRPDAMAARR